MNAHNLPVIIVTFSDVIMNTILMGISIACFRCYFNNDGMPFFGKVFMGIIGTMGIVLSIFGYLWLWIYFSERLL